MTLRDHTTAKKRYAHEILDQVRAGLEVEPKLVAWALCILGDLA